MCTASLEKGYYWNSAKNTTPSQKKQVRFAFAMKLPLFSCQKVCDDDENNAISRGREHAEETMAAAVRQQEKSTRGAPHSPNAAVNLGGGGMRRVKSANASRPRGAVSSAEESGMNNPFPKSRSHSQESRPRNAVYEEVVAPPAPPSEQLPIPQCKNKLLEIARKNSDQTDLRRMYDYATWNMYDRIVSARNKKRMSEQDQDEPDTLINQGSSSSSSASKHTDKTSPTVSTTATTSCNSSLTSSPNLAAIACKGSGILKTSGNNKKTTATTIKKVQASASSNTTNTTSASATTTTVTQAMSTASLNQQQQAATTKTHATQTSSLHYKLRSIKKSFSSHDTDSSQGGTAATTESTSTESEDSQSGCNSPATFPGCMMTSGRSHEHRTLSQGSEDDHFIFQLDM